MKSNLKSRVFTISVFLLLGASAMAQFSQQAKIVSENREGRAEYGTSVAITENFAVVGTSREAFASGAAYIYAKDNQGAWSFSQRIAADDPNDGAEYGGGVKFSDDFLVVAAGRADVNGVIRAGALYVYDYENNNWEFDTKLVTSDYSGDAKLGMNPTTIDVEGNTIVAGAPGEDAWTGSVYVFTKVAGVWEETQKIMSPNPQPNDIFGIGVSISGDYLLVGAQGVDGSKGAGYVYVKNRDGEYVYDQTITASDGAEVDYFGSTVSLSDDRLMVGSYGADGEQGSAYIFEMDTQGAFLEVQKLNGNPSTEAAHFGWYNIIEGDYALVTAPHIYGYEPGEVYVYKRDNTGMWVEEEITQGEDTQGEDFYGWSMDLYKNELIVGSPREDHDETGNNEVGDAGSAYIFQNPTLLGLSDFNANANAIAVYPNPVTDVLHVQMKNSTVTNITVYGINGIKLMEVNGVSTIETSKLSAGVYLLSIKDENNQIFYNRFVKK
ncbi:T9SS type A sorting domain-containing protein [Aequorivita sp. Q41]|uniref:T9SS type A sorting domain-containing protein n=1 Tax=Aequorivita sp. Q41 TaxID=3153300 RepID=UPI0032421DD5